jgi:hypothetical protein
MEDERRRKMVSKLYPKWQFESYCKDRGWKYHATGMHETHVNSNKLAPTERLQPSYIVDQGFGEPETPLVWVEIKSFSKTGLIKIQKEEWALHNRFNEFRPVYYALYRPADKIFHNIIHIDNLKNLLVEEDGFLTVEMAQIEELQ